MILRAIALLLAVIALSVAATLYFGQEVLIALGLILTQSKFLAKKLISIELPAMLGWLKAQVAVFFRVELLKRWVMTTALPLVLGRAALRRLSAYLRSYGTSVRTRYDALLVWYHRLGTVEKALATLIILFATLALSVTSIGLWLILFSVNLPLWIAAGAAAFWRILWASLQKMAFRAVAFLQLRWLWSGVRRLLPTTWLERKRRFDFRVARSVIRRRRMTLRQLEERKDSLPFRLGLFVEYLGNKPRE